MLQYGRHCLVIAAEGFENNLNMHARRLGLVRLLQRMVQLINERVDVMLHLVLAAEKSQHLGDCANVHTQKDDINQSGETAYNKEIMRTDSSSLYAVRHTPLMPGGMLSFTRNHVQS